MDIDFIKWKIEYAEEFELVCNGDIVRFRYQGKQNHDNVLSPNITNWCFSPLLNHRAVIGVNKHSEAWSIVLYPFITVVTDNEDINVRFGDGDIGQSQEENIEQALKYVYEQEKVNEN